MVEKSDTYRYAPWLRRLCWALLIVHVSWIGVHAYYHSKNFLNPWKLAGYAMYTRPEPHYFARAAIVSETGQILSYLPKQIHAFHSYATAGCLAGIRPSFYDWFLIAQYDKVKGRRLKFEFFESIQSMSPARSVSDNMIGYAYISTTTDGDFLVKESFCDVPKEFIVEVIE